MSNDTWTLILLLAAVFGALAAIAAFSSRGSLDSIKSKDVGDGQHGTARWATPAEVRKTFHSVPFQPALWRKGAAPGRTGVGAGLCGKAPGSAGVPFAWEDSPSAHPREAVEARWDPGPSGL